MLSVDEINKLQEENERLKKEIKINLQRANALNRELNQLQTCLQEIKGIVTALYMNEWLQQNETARKSIQLLQEKIAECEVNDVHD